MTFECLLATNVSRLHVNKYKQDRILLYEGIPLARSSLFAVSPSPNPYFPALYAYLFVRVKG